MQTSLRHLTASVRHVSGKARALEPFQIEACDSYFISFSMSLNMIYDALIVFAKIMASHKLIISRGGPKVIIPPGPFFSSPRPSYEGKRQG